MKYLFSFLLILCCGYTLCQEVSDSTQTEEIKPGDFADAWVSSNYVLSFEYGVSKYRLKSLNDQLKTGSNSHFSDYLGSFGVSGFGTMILNREYIFDSHLDCMFYHSVPVVLELNDSTRYYMRGFHIGLDVCFDAFPKQKNFDVIMGTGFNAGRMIFGNWDLTVEEKTNRRNKYVNPFFAPKLTLEPRVILFKHVSISVRSEWQLDITNPRWKTKNDKSGSMGSFTASGYSLRLVLGWRN